MMLTRVLLLFSALTLATPAAEKEKVADPALTGKPWVDMDYGPFLSCTLEAPFPEKNIAEKAICLSLAPEEAGAPRASMVFDTDLLRWAACWDQGFVELLGVVYDGAHWAWPKLQGRQLLGTERQPGWALEGTFSDPRPRPYGPPPPAWGRWKGLHVHGNRVVLSYDVPGASILELASAETAGASPVLARTLDIGPRSASLLTELFFRPGATFERLEDGRLLVARATSRGGKPAAPGLPPVSAAALVGAPVAGVELRGTSDGRALLALTAGASPVRLKVLLLAGTEDQLPAFSAAVSRSQAPAPLEALTHGGPAHWPQSLVTRARSGAGEGPFAVDEIEAPENNPWHSWLRFGGLDWLGPESAVLSTWNGDVWTVRGLGGGLERLEWRRIAAGLYQPLGIAVRDGEIFTVGRDQITRLRDLNGDGEVDFYECFNNDAQNTEHFHEFAMDLQVDAEGTFYYMKGARHALDSVVPQHGTLIRVSRDGKQSEILANGFRAPNGLCLLGPDRFLSTDQQGHWLPANRINLLHRGSFGGNMFSFHQGERPKTFDPPLCWIHPTVDRSPSSLVVIHSKKWGPLDGSWLEISYGMGQLFLVPHETVPGSPDRPGQRLEQGAVVKLPLEFDTGICRGKFHPGDGQLYLCGLFGWAGNKTRPGGLYRVRATGKPFHVPLQFHAFEGALEVTFTDPLDPVAAEDPGNYRAETWDYRWTENYGSPDIRKDGKEGRDRLRVAAARLGPDRRTVTLEIPDLRPAMQTQVDFHLRGAGGEEVQTSLHATLHALAPRQATAPGVARAPVPGVPGEALRQGVVQLVGAAGKDGKPPAMEAHFSRLVALNVPAGEPAASFLPPGAFHSVWKGSVELDLNETCRFAFEGRGEAALLVNGRRLLARQGEDLAGAESEPVELSQGLQPIEVEYRSPATGDASFRLLWKLGKAPWSPVPPTVLRHDASDPALTGPAARRRGRALFAELRCGRCHLPREGKLSAELALEAPLLGGIGDRFDSTWIARKIVGPELEGPHARMPRVVPGGPVEALADARDLTAYLLALPRGSSVQAVEAPPPATDLAGKGAALAAELGCEACHLLPGATAAPGEDRVKLDGLALRWKPGALAAYLLAPARVRPQGRMPDFSLSRDESTALAAFLEGSGSRAAPGPGAARAADPERGKRLARSLRCAACHADSGLDAPQPAPPLEDILAAPAKGCLSGSRETAALAPRHNLSAGEREDLRAFLVAAREARKTGSSGSSAGGTAADSVWRESPAEAAGRILSTHRCGACHAIDGIAATWSEPAPTSLDSGDASGALRSIHRVRPPLTWAGEKLRPEWIEELLAGRLGYKPRPHLLARMPSFPAVARSLAAGLPAQHGMPARTAPRPPHDPGLAELGRRITSGKGFVCQQCHPLPGAPALAGPDTETIDLSRVSHRLTEKYFYRFLLDPNELLPGSMMPRYTTDDGRSVLRDILDGDATRQFEAIWHYLRSLERSH